MAGIAAGGSRRNPIAPEAIYDALRRVSLEHVPQILATGRWQDRAYEVAEELKGGTLADLGIVGDVHKVLPKLLEALKAN